MSSDKLHFFLCQVCPPAPSHSTMCSAQTFHPDVLYLDIPHWCTSPRALWWAADIQLMSLCKSCIAAAATRRSLLLVPLNSRATWRPFLCAQPILGWGHRSFSLRMLGRAAGVSDCGRVPGLLHLHIYTVCEGKADKLGWRWQRGCAPVRPQYSDPGQGRLPY